MDSEASKSNELDRRRSVRASAVYDGEEDHELALAGVVVDGFRPPQTVNASEPSAAVPTSNTNEPRPSDETSPSPSAPERQDEPSSISKPPIPPDTSTPTHQSNDMTQQQTDSSTSTGVVPLDTGSYQGPTGPTHPYELFRQDVGASETLSTTTSSAVPATETPYQGPSRPTHPYGLYPQSDGIEATISQPEDIPIGFRPLPVQYQRRIGPDGEEMGIVGPDGHTEQLPPYTRYPEEAYGGKPPVPPEPTPTVIPAASLVAAPAPAAANPTAQPSTVSNIPGAGGIGLATRNPEFESTEELDTPQSPNSASSFTSDDSQRAIRPKEEQVAEKKEPEQKPQPWLKQRVCGIVPYWALCLVAFVLVVMAIVLGAVIGTTPNRQQAPTRKDPPLWTGTWEWVKPIETPPPDLQPLATGTFSLPVIPNIAPNTCIKDTSLSQAWTCSIYPEEWHLTIMKDGNGYSATLNSSRQNTVSANVYHYGEQPPTIEEPISLKLVTDTFEPTRGPAWYNVARYTKTVIVPGPVLDPANNRTRRAVPVSSLLKRKEPAQPGEKVWICTWPNTPIDVFIYAQQNSSFSNNWSSKSSSSLVSSTASTSTPSSPITPPPSPLPTTTSNDDSEPASNPTSADPDEPKTGDIDFDDNQRRRFRPRWRARSPAPFLPTNTPPVTTVTTTTTIEEPTTTTDNTEPSTSTPSSSSAANPHTSSPPPMYPRVVKLSEYRLWNRNMPKAQCTQVEVRGAGEPAKVLLREDGKPVVVEIEETEWYMGPMGGSGNNNGENPWGSLGGGDNSGRSNSGPSNEGDDQKKERRARRRHVRDVVLQARHPAGETPPAGGGGGGGGGGEAVVVEVEVGRWNLEG